MQTGASFPTPHPGVVLFQVLQHVIQNLEHPSDGVCVPLLLRSPRDALHPSSYYLLPTSAFSSLVVLPQVLKQVVQSLEHPSDGVRAAAALCVMGLSRSISTLRSSLLETEVAEVLCRLLHDRCVDVQVWNSGQGRRGKGHCVCR